MAGNWVVGNWKMNGSLELIKNLASALKAPQDKGDPDTVIGICPPYPFLAPLAQALSGTRVLLGAQNVHEEASGAFTGEVSAQILRELGAHLCIVGHSERRQVFGESDVLIAKKLGSVLQAGMTPILCVGESLAHRESGSENAVVKAQLQIALGNLAESAAARVVLAYEPVWAIGTGKTASPEQAEAMHAHIRGWLAESWGQALAANSVILYGGSVSESNAAELFGMPQINGGLIGGASLKPDAFLKIIHQAQNNQ